MLHIRLLILLFTCILLHQLTPALALSLQNTSSPLNLTLISNNTLNTIPPDPFIYQRGPYRVTFVISGRSTFSSADAKIFLLHAWKAQRKFRTEHGWDLHHELPHNCFEFSGVPGSPFPFQWSIAGTGSKDTKHLDFGMLTIAIFGTEMLVAAYGSDEVRECGFLFDDTLEVEEARQLLARGDFKKLGDSATTA